MTEESEALGKFMYRQDGSLNPMAVGKNPQFLAREKSGIYNR